MLAVTFTCGCIKCNNMYQATPIPAPITEVNVTMNNSKKIQNNSSAHFGSDNTLKSWCFSIRQKKPQPTTNPTPSPTPDTEATVTPTTTTSSKLVRPAPHRSLAPSYRNHHYGGSNQQDNGHPPQEERHECHQTEGLISEIKATKRVFYL